LTAQATSGQIEASKDGDIHQLYPQQNNRQLEKTESGVQHLRAKTGCSNACGK